MIARIDMYRLTRDAKPYPRQTRMPHQFRRALLAGRIELARAEAKGERP